MANSPQFRSKACRSLHFLTPCAFAVGPYPFSTSPPPPPLPFPPPPPPPAPGVPKVAYRVPGANQADWVDIYNRMYRERIIFLGQEIDDEICNQIIAVMLFSDSEEPPHPTPPLYPTPLPHPYSTPTPLP